MQKETSFSRILLSDFKRKFQYVPREFPNNKFGLVTSITLFILGSKGFRSVFFYRLMSIKFRNNHTLRIFISILRVISFSIEIPYTAQIGEGFLIGHHEGVIINGDCIIGKNFTIQQGVTIGGNIGKIKEGRETPLIGDNVFIGAGAKVLGPIKIGDNSMIGANAVVIKNVPNDSVAVGIPAKVIKKVDKPYIEIEKEYDI